MAFGPTMRLKVPQKDGSSLTVELAPLTRDVLERFVTNGGMQSYPVIRYLSRQTSPVLEDEIDWFDKARADEYSVIWGVWLVEANKRLLIGSSGLTHIEVGPTGIKQATSGVMIFDRAYWGKGITSYIHRARTWFAFTQLGLTRIKSAVIQANPASLRTLEKVGYTFVYVERNTNFTDGVLRHQDNLECLNPLEPFWSNWWGSDTPTAESQVARKLTEAALSWADTELILP
ncbi:MAG TPA: GNAT family protein [Candidatus Saccharimonadales bacterium]|nr:GNAT family protein [Candidatus Saccharimonadales bacterium]